MLGKLIPVLLALIGLGAGIGAGIALRPAPEEVALENPCGDPHHEAPEPKEEPAAETESIDFVKLNNQFVVPVVKDGSVGALVVLSINLEVAAGQTEEIYELEPKLRDGFLRVLFDHANAGGFSGDFTKSTRMNTLRTALREAAQGMVGNSVSDVLIVDIVRQDA